MSEAPIDSISPVAQTPAKADKLTSYAHFEGQYSGDGVKL
jgi:hypothetical protein